MNWQPIETAPKDGTQFLCCTTCGVDENGLKRMVGLGKWKNSYPKGFVVQMFGFSSSDPVYWMPLPDPPKI